jgi:predicted nucleic acid-binding protein
MIVVDASVVVDTLVGEPGAASWSGWSDEVTAPELILPEVVNAIARMVRRGALERERAGAALSLLEVLPVELQSSRAHVARVFELTDRLSAYDAAYVALAEAEGATIVTRDGRLARAHDLPVPVVAI